MSTKIKVCLVLATLAAASGLAGKAYQKHLHKQRVEIFEAGCLIGMGAVLNAFGAQVNDDGIKGLQAYCEAQAENVLGQNKL